MHLVQYFVILPIDQYMLKLNGHNMRLMHIYHDYAGFSVL